MSIACFGRYSFEIVRNTALRGGEIRAVLACGVFIGSNRI